MLAFFKVPRWFPRAARVEKAALDRLSSCFYLRRLRPREKKACPRRQPMRERLRAWARELPHLLFYSREGWEWRAVGPEPP